MAPAVPRRILFVCSGNTCRSPMAQAIATEIARARGLTKKVSFDSAGLGPYGFVTSAALKALEALGVENKSIRGRRSQGLDLVLQRERCDLVIVMTEEMKVQVSLPPGQSIKILTLREIANESGDVDDPIGKSDLVYLETAKEIRRLLEAGWHRIMSAMTV